MYQRDCRGSSTVSCLNTQSPADGALWRVRRFGLLGGGELWEFKGSSHFKLDLCFVLPVPDVSTQFPALTAKDLLCHQCSNPPELQINSSKSCLGYDILSQ